MNYYEGKVISIDSVGTNIKDDAFSVQQKEDGGYLLHVFITNPITYNETFIEKITKEFKEVGSYTTTSFIRNRLRNESLNSNSERRVFDFCFDLDKFGNVLSFEMKRTKIMIELELDYDEVCEEIEENFESELTEFFTTAYTLGELLYKKRTNGKEFTSYNDCLNYDMPFPREFITLVNLTLAQKLYEDGIPFIYDVAQTDSKYGNKKMIYYTSERRINEIYNNYYGAFTSPIQNYEDLKNLEIINKIYFSYFSSKKEKEDAIEFYKNQISGHFEIKQNPFEKNSYHK